MGSWWRGFWRRGREGGQDGGKGDIGEQAEAAVFLQFGARGCGGVDAAKKAGHLARSRQRLMLLRAQLAHLPQLVGIDGARRRVGQRARRLAQTRVAVAAILVQRFPEIIEQVGGAAAGGAGERQDLIQPFDVLLFALKETGRQPVGQLAHVKVTAEQAVPQACAGGLELEVALFLEVIQCGDDPLPRGAGGMHGRCEVELHPRPAELSGFEERAEKSLALLVEAGEGLVRGAEALELVLAVERARGGDDAFDLEVSQDGLDDERANVVCCGEVVD